ncbi:response regulator [Haliovirga abyssi]|uniref:Response regulatory domain-containing protein n=1 Tax=Haliovirga abyssi TaxID=2996794 RepID=A0AAU9D2H5_9FUSO|nr:response regulator [Haliovirga abyssi]BDU50194.1 hypothetical protein HLVA_07630 [Haliovirga abyssi]
MKKILIIDDDDNIRRLLKSTLAGIAEVYEADFGKLGFNIFREESPDMILLDIMLPDTSGVELLQKIRDEDMDVKVVMITAYETIKSVIEIMNLKISGYITKPFIVRDVRQKISKLLES